MKLDKKDDIDNPALPLWYVKEVKISRKFYRWFWRGFFVAVPVSFILGHDMYIDRVVRNYSILYLAILVVVMLVYRKSKGLRLEFLWSLL